MCFSINLRFRFSSSCVWSFLRSLIVRWCGCRYLMGFLLLYQKMESYSTTKKWNQNKSPALGILLVESLSMQHLIEAICCSKSTVIKPISKLVLLVGNRHHIALEDEVLTPILLRRLIWLSWKTTMKLANIVSALFSFTGITILYSIYILHLIYKIIIGLRIQSSHALYVFF
jgi:hypothetical protein